MPLWLKKKKVHGSKAEQKKTGLCARERENIKKQDVENERPQNISCAERKVSTPSVSFLSSFSL